MRWIKAPILRHVDELNIWHRGQCRRGYVPVRIICRVSGLHWDNYRNGNMGYAYRGQYPISLSEARRLLAYSSAYYDFIAEEWVFSGMREWLEDRIVDYFSTLKPEPDYKLLRMYRDGMEDGDYMKDIGKQ